MPKDYRRQRSRSFKSNSSNSFAWIMFGMLLGLFGAILFYWKEVVVPAHHAKALPEVAHHNIAPLPQKAQKTTATPEFDFYTVLPKAQAAASHVPATPSVPVAKVAPVVSAVSPSTTASVSAQPVLSSTPVASPTLPAVSSTPTVTSATTLPPVAAPTNMPVALPPASVLAEKTTLPSATRTVTVAPTPPAVTPVETKALPIVKNPVSTNYLLQMGLSKSYTEADRIKAELTMSGFDVSVQPYTMNGQMYHRVVMGPYASKSKALQQRALLQKNGVTSVLVKAP